MTSHRYHVAAKDLARMVGGPLLAVGLFALATHTLVGLGWLPTPRAALDTDRVILLHQVEASRSRRPTEVVLLGDSSCLMDVDARQLAGRLGRSTLNLGTLSYVDLESLGRLLSGFARQNPGSPHVAMLLMHAQSLRVRDTSNQHVRALRAHLAGRDDFEAGTWRGRMDRWLGLEQWRGRVLARGVPFPLAGAYGRHYGFTHDLWRHLDANLGSALDPQQFDPHTATGSAEYRLAPALESESRAFRRLLPSHSTLLVGITPVPATVAGPQPEAEWARMLATWSAWLSPAVALTNLPAVMGAAEFATVTHLNGPGRARYTGLLAEALQEHLNRNPAGPR